MKNKFDLLPYPEDALSLDLEQEFDSFELAYLALKTHIDQRNLLKSVKIKNISKNGEYLKINNFFVQVVLCSYFDDEIIIPISKWRVDGFIPQLILPAQVDNENNIISFPGILTSNEIFINENETSDHINIPLTEFEGGLDLLYSYVTLLKTKSIPRRNFNKLSKSSYFFKKDKSVLKKLIEPSIVLTAIASIFFVPKIFEQRLASNISVLRGQTIFLSDNRRGDFVQKNNFCMLSPLGKEKDLLGENIIYISVDKPVLIFREALNEISILKNNKVIWENKSSVNNKIITPLKWPIRPFEINDSYLLRVRPVGTSIGQFVNIKLESSNKKIEKIEDFEDLLGKNSFKWARAININIDKNPDLAIALLFSKKIPSGDIFEKTKYKFLTESSCK